MRDSCTTLTAAVALGACLALGLPCVPAVADAAPGAKSGAPASRPAAAPAAGDDDGGLEQYMLRRVPVPVTRSRSGAASRSVGAALPPDGSPLNDRTCRLGPVDSQGWRTLLLEPVDGEAPALARRRVLPCRLLERMEAIASKQPKTVFRIWGENTVYHDRLYVLPLVATVVPAPPGSKAPVTGKAASPPKTGAGADKGASDRPAKADPPAGVDDVMRELLRDQPGRTIVVPARLGEGPKDPSGAVAPGVKTPAPRARGELVVDRLVRVEPLAGDETWHVMRFESDNTLAEPPMRLLPCRMCARAEGIAAEGWLLRVTGRITVYKRNRYVLLRKVLRQRRLGRF